MGHFEVDDLEAVMRDLSSRGVTFEEYETPKTVGGMAQIGRLAGRGSRIRTAMSSGSARPSSQRDPCGALARST